MSSGCTIDEIINKYNSSIKFILSYIKNNIIPVHGQVIIPYYVFNNNYSPSNSVNYKTVVGFGEMHCFTPEGPTVAQLFTTSDFNVRILQNLMSNSIYTSGNKDYMYVPSNNLSITCDSNGDYTISCTVTPKKNITEYKHIIVHWAAQAYIVS